MKKLSVIFLVLTLMLTGCGADYKEVDLSDIKDMVVYTEDPNLLYADENRTIIYFNGFGVIVFDIKEGTVTDRISAEELYELLEGEYPDVRASVDGKTVYIGIDDMMDEDSNFVYEYDIEKGKLAKINKSVTETETFRLTAVDSKPYLIAEMEGSFAYLQLEGGYVETLQLVICPYDTDKNTVIYIFK